MTRLYALALLALTLIPTQAEAGCVSYGWRRVCNADWPVASCWSQRYCRQRDYDESSYRRYDPRPERVYAYERRAEERWERRDAAHEVGVSCKGIFVRVVGQSELSEKGAIAAAVRQWQSTVSYDYGEKFMSVENARAYRWRCDRASTNESFIGKLAESASGGESGFRRRCVVIAEPCMQPTKAGDKDER